MKSGTPGPLKASGPRPLLCSEQTLPIFLASSWWGSMPLAWVLISKPDFIGAPGDHGARHCQSDPVRFKTLIFESKAWETNMMGGSFHPFGNRTSPSRASLTLVSPPWMWRPVRNLLCVGLPPQLYYCRIYRVGMYCTDCLWLFNLLNLINSSARLQRMRTSAKIQRKQHGFRQSMHGWERLHNLRRLSDSFGFSQSFVLLRSKKLRPLHLSNDHPSSLGFGGAWPHTKQHRSLAFPANSAPLSDLEQSSGHELWNDQNTISGSKWQAACTNNEYRKFRGEKILINFSGSGLVLYIDIIVYNCHMAKGQST